MVDNNITCIDCGSRRVSGPDYEGFIDCYACGAAWLPGCGDDPVGVTGGPGTTPTPPPHTTYSEEHMASGAKPTAPGVGGVR